jgi:hypothetical protein
MTESGAGVHKPAKKDPKKPNLLRRLLRKLKGK